LLVSIEREDYPYFLSIHSNKPLTFYYFHADSENLVFIY
jgi:hypothetical protein